MFARGYLPLHFMLKAGVTICAVVWATAGPVSSKSDFSASLAGSWTGGGWVSFASGNKERARCHAHYSRAGGSNYELNATCATASGKASQTALVHQTGATASAAVSTTPNTTCPARSTL